MANYTRLQRTFTTGIPTVLLNDTLIGRTHSHDIYGQLETYSSHEHVYTHTVHTVQLHSTYQKVDACCPPGLRKSVRRAIKYDELIQNIVHCIIHNPIPADTHYSLTYGENNNIFMDDMKLDGLKERALQTEA